MPGLSPAGGRTCVGGRFDSLRERMIGAEMFGRPVDYDTANDAVVRVRATEVRRRLAQYYSETEEPPVIHIDLPSGSYVPKFHREALVEGVPAQQAAAAEAIKPEQQGERPQEPASGESVRRTPWLLVGFVASLALIAGIGYIGVRMWSNGAGAKPEIHSIAVLPLANLSGDTRQEDFADGMTEELITDLGQIAALRVISRTSAMTYKGTKKTLPEIARALGVDAVVEGSVVRESDRARITAQLIDARTDRHLWARTYTRNLTSVLALEGEVAEEIADAVQGRGDAGRETRLARARPINVAAQEQYLLGTYLMNQGDPRHATELFPESRCHRPRIRAGARCTGRYLQLLGQLGFMAYSQAFANQKAEASRSIELDDALPEGHIELAIVVEMLDWDWATAEKELEPGAGAESERADAHWEMPFIREDWPDCRCAGRDQDRAGTRPGLRAFLCSTRNLSITCPPVRPGTGTDSARPLTPTPVSLEFLLVGHY